MRRQRSLVFLLSDFHLAVDELDRVLDSLAMHEVVPVLLWDRAEFEPPPARGGLAPLADAESGHRRLLWLRPAALRGRWVGASRRGRPRSTRCSGVTLRPLRLLDGFDAEAVTQHFHR